MFESIDLCHDACIKMAENLLGKKTLYVLGDNINGPAARESALIFKEKCLIHAEGMTASEFRHGSVEVAEEALPVLMLSPTRSNRQEMEKHAAYLQEKGFDVYLAAPECFPSVSEDRYIPIATSEEDTMGHLSAVIPAQFIAEDLACRMGFDPDGFRFLTKVLANY